MPDTAQIELTDREIALCQGLDPDAKPSEAVQDATEVANDTANSGANPAANDANQEVVKDGGAGASGANDGAASGQPANRDVLSNGGGKDAAGSAWLKAEHQELAKSFGIPSDDLRQFSSADEFSRAMRLVQGHVAAQAMRAQDKVELKAPEPEAKPAEKSNKLQKLDLEKLKAQGYGQDELDLFAKQNELIDYIEQRDNEAKELAQRFARHEQAMAQQEQTRQSDAFHDAVDALGEGRFGKSIDREGRLIPLSEAEDSARRKLYGTVERLAKLAVLEARESGQTPKLPPLSTLVRQAQQIAFADEIRADERRRVQDDITEQSKKRRPVAAGRAPNGQFAKATSESPNDAAKELANNPEIVAFWNKTQEANGAV